MGRPVSDRVGEGKNIVRVHPALREEILNIQYNKYKGRIPFTQASLELVEQKKELELRNQELERKLGNLVSNTGRQKRSGLL